ncbi:MAG: flavin reductase family protein [Erysipelotrichaceae bacterium]|nr:flavin reductase family protein [Erysipelotrichaceae bacterium]
MRKDFGKKTIITPLPVVIIGTYDENGKPNAMNAAWAGQVDADQIIISLSKHQTTDNLEKNGDFTVAFATRKTVVESDYFGIESGRKADKIAKAGFHAVRGTCVNAPVFEEYPLVLECKVVEMKPDGDGYLLTGETVNMSVDESILTDGKVDLSKMEPIMFDSAMNKYRVIGEIVADAFKAGFALK